MSISARKRREYTEMQVGCLLEKSSPTESTQHFQSLYGDGRCDYSSKSKYPLRREVEAKRLWHQPSGIGFSREAIWACDQSFKRSSETRDCSVRQLDNNLTRPLLQLLLLLVNDHIVDCAALRVVACLANGRRSAIGGNDAFSRHRYLSSFLPYDIGL